MNRLFIELNDKEITEVSGGVKEVSVKEAIYAGVGTVAGMFISAYIFDPAIHYFFEKFRKK